MFDLVRLYCFYDKLSLARKPSAHPKTFNHVVVFFVFVFFCFFFCGLFLLLFLFVYIFINGTILFNVITVELM